MTNDFRSCNVIYILFMIVRTKIIGHYSLLITRYSLLGIQTPVVVDKILFEFFLKKRWVKFIRTAIFFRMFNLLNPSRVRLFITSQIV